MNKPAKKASPAPPPAAHWILGFSGPTLPQPLAQAIRDGRVDGLALFRDNTGGSVAAALELRREVLSLVPPGRPFIFTADEEGGLITQTSRLDLPGGGAWPSVPTPRALGRIGKPAACRFVGQLLGHRLRALGVTVDFAPCLDLDTEAENPVIGSRSLSSDPASVAALGLAFAEGLASAGVASCFKHFPGHGGTKHDSHRTLPAMDPHERGLHERPFRECLGAIREAAAEWERRPLPWVMGAHVDWGDGVPASLHPEVLARVRRWLPQALLVTDSLEMGAVVPDPGGVTGTQRGPAARALAAGNDVLLVARDWESALREMAEMAGTSGTAGTGGTAGPGGTTETAETASAAGSPAKSGRVGRARRALVAEELERRTDRRAELPLRPEDPARLAALHLACVRLSWAPSELPDGLWTWVVPEGFAPYARLRDWKPVRGRRRPCGEVVWVPEAAKPPYLAALAKRLGEQPWPILVATLFRGVPDPKVRSAWEPLVNHPRVSLWAHLLDEQWPEPGGCATAWTSGPSVESLNALATALNLPDSAWRRGPDGMHFVVDTGPIGLAK